MKTCGIPSIGEVRIWLAGVGVAATGVSVTGRAVGRMVSTVAEGRMAGATVGGICVVVGSAIGAGAPAQAVRSKNKRKVGMSFFMYFPRGVQERRRGALAPGIKRQVA
jgi:hypothetical protein